MDLINRYIYAVTKGFNQQQRDDIEQELRANIEDMIEQRQETLNYEEAVNQVLLELGNPEELASEYRGSKRYLIGPHFIDSYLLVLKIVLIAVLGGISIALFIESAFSGSGYFVDNFVDLLIKYISALYNGALIAFAWTTLGFVIAEKSNSGNTASSDEKANWDLSKLPEVPNKKNQIKLSETIASIIFTTIFYTIFIALMYSAPELFGVIFNNGKDLVIIPMFNIDVLQSYRILIISVFGMSMISELLKLYYRKWTLQHAILHMIFTVASTIIVLFILNNPAIWNADFANEVNNRLNLAFDFTKVWQSMLNWVVSFIIIITGIDIFVPFYKGTKKY